jgi:thioredoxin 1
MAGEVIAVTDQTFQAEVLDSKVPTVVDFWAEWCGPCRKVGPLVEELAAENAAKVRFAKVNVDENPATPAKYAIMSIPTIILFRNGQVVDKLVGARSKADYQNWINAKV